MNFVTTMTSAVRRKHLTAFEIVRATLSRLYGSKQFARMSFTRVSLKNFLSNARLALQSAVEHKKKVTFVIGNESAGTYSIACDKGLENVLTVLDLDSFTCSLVYAYIRSARPPQRAFSPTYVPLLNIPRADIELRPEFLALLRHVGLQDGDLISLSDLPDEATIRAKLSPETTQWILVDHNSLQGSLGSIYGERVAGVIDHHAEEDKVPKDTGDEPRIVEKAGSCSSLVTTYLRGSWEALSTPEASIYDAQAARLVLASILVDTRNLQSKGKVMPSDEEAVNFLETKIKAASESNDSFDRKAFFEEINQAKLNIGSLELQGILRKDYKQWTENGRILGISSAVKPISFLREKAETEAKAESSGSKSFLRAIDHFAETRRLGLYAIMTASTSAEGEFQRELMVRAFTVENAQTVKKFADENLKTLGLEDWTDSKLDHLDGDKIWSKVWWQRHVEHSRKQVGPLLREAMR